MMYHDVPTKKGAFGKLYVSLEGKTRTQRFCGPTAFSDIQPLRFKTRSVQSHRPHVRRSCRHHRFLPTGCQNYHSQILWDGFLHTHFRRRGTCCTIATTQLRKNVTFQYGPQFEYVTWCSRFLCSMCNTFKLHHLMQPHFFANDGLPLNSM